MIVSFYKMMHFDQLEMGILRNNTYCMRHNNGIPPSS